MVPKSGSSHVGRSYGGRPCSARYASSADAQANAAPLRTFSDHAFKAWGDLTFTDNDTLLFSSFGVSWRAFGHASVDPGDDLIDLRAGQEGPLQRHLPKAADAPHQGSHQTGLPTGHAGFDGAVP